MKKLNLFIQLLLLGCLSVGLQAQNYYNIRLEKIESGSTSELCFEVQLASAQASDFNLAGQNYRLYYDAASLQFNEAHSKTLLASSQYTAAKIKDNLHGIDASGAGILPFENQLAFLNIGLDLIDASTGGFVLPASGAWQATMQLCFDLKEEMNLAEIANTKSIYWAREDLTDSYATAYVEVAEWIKPNTTQPAMAAEYHDMNLSTALSDFSLEKAPLIFPNPTKDKVWIDYQSEQPIQLEIRSVNGQLIKNQQNLDMKNGLFQFTLAHQPTGWYQIILKDGQKIFTKSVEKIQ